MNGKKWWQVTPAVAKAALSCVRLGHKEISRYPSMATNATYQATNTFHGENISSKRHCNAFSNELQIVLPVESAAHWLVSAQVWRVICNKSEQRKFVLVLLQCLCTASCRAVNVKGNSWWGSQSSECPWGSHRLSREPIGNCPLHFPCGTGQPAPPASPMYLCWLGPHLTWSWKHPSLDRLGNTNPLE